MLVKHFVEWAKVNKADQSILEWLGTFPHLEDASIIFYSMSVERFHFIRWIADRIGVFPMVLIHNFDDMFEEAKEEFDEKIVKEEGGIRKNHFQYYERIQKNCFTVFITSYFQQHKYF
jgi:hypothetical protein